MPQFSTTRACVVILIIGGLLSALVGRVAYLQTYGRQSYVRAAERQQHTGIPIQARRGSIFDRNGHEMAGTIQTLAVYLDPKFMLEQYQTGKRNLNQMDQDLTKLATIIDCDADKLTAVICENVAERYIRIAENQTDQAAREIAKLNIPGAGVEPMCVRFYPMGSLAAHIIGSCDKFGEGQEGLEFRYQKVLAGRNGYRRIEKDARRRPIGIDAEDYSPATHGQNIVLTIDAAIQMMAEEELSAACKQFKARRGEVVIIDPRTGEILALANWPGYDPQNRGATSMEAHLDRAIVVPYEPGSTLKPFIMGPALAWHITRINEMWQIPGITWVTSYGRHVSDVHHYGPLCTWDVPREVIQHRHVDARRPDGQRQSPQSPDCLWLRPAHRYRTAG